MNGKTRKIFHLQSEFDVARLHSQLSDNELWFY